MKIGIIGGSGLEKSDLLKNKKELVCSTKFGKPSDKILKGKIGNHDIFFLARHGRKHNIIPSEVNNRANILALKNLCCTHIIATTAVGSLQEHMHPGDLVILDQFIDRTTKRASTLYTKNVCHIPMGEPFCPKLRTLLINTAKKLRLKCHEKGTVITIEGPRFSTKAESHLFRSWKADVINMSTVPEVILAREAGICYASIAMSTDYDVWKKNEKPVSWERIMKTMKKNAENVQQLILHALEKLEIEKVPCSCREAYKTAIVK